MCHGAYVASDFEIVKAYPSKKFIWGYFPAAYTYDLETLFARRQRLNQENKTEVRILWAGRFLKLKHPEYAVKAAYFLKQQKVAFHLDMVGGGELEEKLRAMVQWYGLADKVAFHGFQPPKVVRRFMEEADIFLFTSDYLEGWGAVLNESMNSACAVIAGHGIGAVPFLLKHGKNGWYTKQGILANFGVWFGSFAKIKTCKKGLAPTLTKP